MARSLGLPFTLEPDLTAAALRIALAVPDGTERLEPGAAFQPSLAVPDAASELDRIVAVLGRSPTWPD